MSSTTGNIYEEGLAGVTLLATMHREYNKDRSAWQVVVSSKAHPPAGEINGGSVTAPTNASIEAV